MKTPFDPHDDRADPRASGPPVGRPGRRRSPTLLKGRPLVGGVLAPTKSPAVLKGKPPGFWVRP